MPVRHIKVDRGQSPEGYTSSGQKYIPDPPPGAGLPPPGGKKQEVAPRNAVPDRRERVQNPSDLQHLSHHDVSDGLAAPGVSEPRSGGPQERALTSPSQETRHPNVLQIERGNDFYAAGTSEAHNDEKFNNPNRMVVIFPPAGFERLPGEPNGTITEVSKTHGYDPATLAYAAESLAEAQNQYVPLLPMRERGTGVVGDYPQEWGQPRMILGPEEKTRSFENRGDLSVDTGQERLKDPTNWIPGARHKNDQ